MIRSLLFVSLSLLLVRLPVSAQIITADDTGQALLALAQKRAILGNSKDPKQISEMLKLGMWNEAIQLINRSPDSQETKLLKAQYAIHHNDFKKASSLVQAVLIKSPGHEQANELKAFLEIQSWQLSQAESTCSIYLRNNASLPMMLVLGKTMLLQKKYDDALALARSVQKADPGNAGSYLLEANVYFWNQQPEKAEQPLKKSIELDPFNADARFAYGYAIWRRIDATQLDEMAAQWEIALQIDPLHYQTHWHWGNGHTQLTYADYVTANDEEVRAKLKPADQLVSNNQLDAAIAHVKGIQQQYPTSVLPDLHLGSLYYNDFGPGRGERLDSAEVIFLNVLRKLKHYGPAHNGLAAVIKSKRIPYLAMYDSVLNALNKTSFVNDEAFQQVFPDVQYYPGKLAKAMVWNQLYTSTAYFPFLTRQNNRFRIPPLHIDLAVAMGQPSFRRMTTFDNRQWMDIRGVGSGAAAIEYVEKGAFLERNVVLHEYVHLFHQRVLTDQENREIRQHYFTAMKEHRTLDYYSQNNEHEYFAQTYPAFFEPVKVHPQDFKSMNTTADLQRRDPGMFGFLNRLVKKERAFLAGDTSVMKSNWAQVYINLSAAQRIKDPSLTRRLLDTALQYDPDYMPVYLAYAGLLSDQQQWESALTWIRKVQDREPQYAPSFIAESRLLHNMFLKGAITAAESNSRQQKLYRRAISLEKDLYELALASAGFRDMLRAYGSISESVKEAERYAVSGSTVSTYLRDRRDDALAYIASTKAHLGYSSALETVLQLVSRKPQNFEYRIILADALATHGQFGSAVRTIQEAQRILSASGGVRPDYALRLAEYYHALGSNDSAKMYLRPFIAGRMRPAGSDQLRLIRLLNDAGEKRFADSIASKIDSTGPPYHVAELQWTMGYLAAANGLPEKAVDMYERSLSINSYNPVAVKQLFALYKTVGNTAGRKRLILKLKSLELPFGNLFQDLSHN